MIIDIVEQHAIYDGKPNLQPLGMAINMLNYHAFGGSPNDLIEAKKDRSLENPKRYKVKLTLSIEEVK